MVLSVAMEFLEFCTYEDYVYITSVNRDDFTSFNLNTTFFFSFLLVDLNETC